MKISLNLWYQFIIKHLTNSCTIEEQDVKKTITLVFAFAMKKLIFIFLMCFGIYEYLHRDSNTAQIFQPSFAAEYSSSDEILKRAYRNRQSNLQVSGSGRVIKILSDDLKGSRHQRFILKLSTGQTLLVAHNIDLSPRINSLRTGDMVKFYGEYEWNAKGGVLHWTHHDPNGRHEDGWLIHNGITYK